MHLGEVVSRVNWAFYTLESIHIDRFMYGVMHSGFVCIHDAVFLSDVTYLPGGFAVFTMSLNGSLI